jgi:hypothetical protein
MTNAVMLLEIGAFGAEAEAGNGAGDADGDPGAAAVGGGSTVISGYPNVTASQGTGLVTLKVYSS